ncbi:RNA binding motif protein 12Ba isoform 1-T3 [Pholidichthys leucotaenia]
MSIILRLQGLDVKAGIADIRAFFGGAYIPDGGVYVVGGSLGEAFIAFSKERDAQLAMRLSGSLLKGSKVTLHISSLAELEHKLVLFLKNRKQFSPLSVKRLEPEPAADLTPANERVYDNISTQLSPSAAASVNPDFLNVPLNAQGEVQTLAINSLDSGTAFLLGVCTVLQGLKSSHQQKNNIVTPGSSFYEGNCDVGSDEMRTPDPIVELSPGYVRLFGLPVSTTKEDICHFFKGLAVQEAIVNVKLGLKYGCLVKFASVQDACSAIRFNQQSLGPYCVEVRSATEKIWEGALQECENGFDTEQKPKSWQNPLKESLNHKRKSVSALQTKRHAVKLLPSKPLKKQKRDQTDSRNQSSLTVMVRNLPQKMTKTEIKELFRCPNIAHKNVLHLLDKEGNRTDTAFIIFDHMADYEYALNLSGCHVGSDAIEVSPITKELMREKLAKSHPKNRQVHLKSNPRKRPER